MRGSRSPYADIVGTRVIVEEANYARVPVAAHCECASAARDAAEAGVWSIEHGEDLDAETIAAALLHDTVEDTALTAEEVEQEFGPEVARLVEGVTKLGRISLRSDQQQQAENIRKMMVAMAEDLRVVLIKLADRLHNMRTLEPLAEAKRRKISRETLDIYAPLAHRLGIGQVKWELEDLAFQNLEPEAFDPGSAIAAAAPSRNATVASAAAAALHNRVLASDPTSSRPVVTGGLKNTAPRPWIA